MSPKERGWTKNGCCRKSEKMTGSSRFYPIGSSFPIEQKNDYPRIS